MSECFDCGADGRGCLACIARIREKTAEARTREIAKWVRDGFSTIPQWDAFVADAIEEKFLPKEKPAVVTSGAEGCTRRGCTQPNCLGHD